MRSLDRIKAIVASETYDTKLVRNCIEYIVDLHLKSIERCLFSIIESNPHKESYTHIVSSIKKDYATDESIRYYKMVAEHISAEMMHFGYETKVIVREEPNDHTYIEIEINLIQ